jgi:hypothetical protein
VKTGETSTGPGLFDLATDPSEQKNVAADHPDVVARLQSLFDETDRERATIAERASIGERGASAP